MDDLIFNVTTAEFQARVLDRSAEVPVLVDFWAAWCGPCRVLAPVLEKAVRDLGGRVLLAKVDTDREPELAARYQIRGIPAVKVFRDGKLVEEFTGARDARFVRAFLERVAPSQEAQQLERAAALLGRGEAAEAEAILRPLLIPGAPGRVPLLLAQALLLSGAGTEEPRRLLQQIDPRGPEAERAESISALLAFLDEAMPEEEARARLARDEKDHDARYGLAAALGRRGRWEEALGELLEIVSRSRRYRDDGARRAMVAVFDLLGAEHPLVAEHRRRLQVLL